MGCPVAWSMRRFEISTRAWLEGCHAYPGLCLVGSRLIASAIAGRCQRIGHVDHQHTD